MKTFQRGVTAAALLLALSGCGIFKRSGAKVKVPGERIAILARETSVEADPATATLPLALPTATVNDAWTQPGGNAAHSMGHVALASAINPLWQASVTGVSKETRYAAAPVVAGGALYVMDTSSTVHAFDANTGARRWSVPFAREESKKERGAAFGGGVSVEGDRLFVTNGLGDVAALKTSDGSTIWKKTLGPPLRGAPSVALGLVLVTSQDNQLFALNETDGATQWSSAAAVQLAGIFGASSPAVAQGTVVAGFSSGDLNAYRYENGRTLWQDALSRTSVNTSVGALTDIDADPVIDQGRVFAIGQGGRMVALELLTGQRVWELNIAGISTPWVAGDWLFVVTDDARLLCVARATGKVRWVQQLVRYRNLKSRSGPISWTGPVLAGGRLILASNTGEMVQVAPEDGKVQSTVRLRAGVSQAPVVANNTLYLLQDDGRVVAYR